MTYIDAMKKVCKDNSETIGEYGYSNYWYVLPRLNGILGDEIGYDYYNGEDGNKQKYKHRFYSKNTKKYKEFRDKAIKLIEGN